MVLATRKNLPKLLFQSLNMARNLVFCINCIEISRKCLQFKYYIISAQKSVISLACTETNVDYNIRTIYQKYNDINYKTVVEQDLNICRLCLVSMDKDKSTALDIISNTLVLKLFPEVDFNMIRNPMVCVSCKTTLQVYFKLAINFIYMKETIKSNINQTDLQSNTTFETTNTIRKSFIKERNQYLANFKDMYEYSIDSLKINTKPSPGTKSYKCQKCSFKTKHKTNLQSHVCTGIRFHKCPICPYRSKRRTNLRTHSLVHKTTEEIVMYQCSVCHSTFKRKPNLMRHMLVHETNARFECTKCGFKTKYKECFLRHNSLHQEETYKCVVCSYTCKREYTFKSHMELHDMSKETDVFRCSICPYDCKQRYLLKRHMLVHEKSYKCKKCSFITEDKEELGNHNLSVHMLQTFNCPVCSRTFKQNYMLKRHMVVHQEQAEIVMHQCDKCSFKTRFKGSLFNHMSIHRDDTWKCSVCPYTCKHKNTLNVHMKTHMEAQ